MRARRRAYAQPQGALHEVAAVWVVREDEGRLGAEGRAALEAWLAETPRHVLRALYSFSADQRATVRFSLGRSSTETDVERAAATTSAIVARLRAHGAGSTARA